MASSEERLKQQSRKKRKGSSLQQVSLLDQWKTFVEKENASSAAPQQQRSSLSLKPAPPTRKASHAAAAAAAASFFLPRKIKKTAPPRPFHSSSVARVSHASIPQQPQSFHVKSSAPTIIDLTTADGDDENNDDDNINDDSWMNQLFTTQEFHAMWLAAEIDHGLATDEIEHSKLIRAANTKVAASDSRQQARAQYGRLLSQGFDVLTSAKVLDLHRNDTFIDIGHGIGSLVLHAAYTIGCNARGIELDADRNVVAGIYKRNLDHQRTSFPQYQNHNGGHNGDKYQPRTVGSVHFEHGELSDPKHWLFLSGGVKQRRGRGMPPPNLASSLDDYIAFPKHLVKVWVNNYNGVFSEKSAKKTGNKISMYYLDHFIGGLLALMKPGSIMVTLHKLPLGPSLQDVNRHLQRRHLPYRPDASFFSLETVDLGAANEIVSWSEGGGCTETITAYKYTRVDQHQGEIGNKAVFYCFNPDCEEYNVAQPVLEQVEQCGPKLVARTGCRANCACNIRESRSSSSNRKRQATTQPTQEH